MNNIFINIKKIYQPISQSYQISKKLIQDLGKHNIKKPKGYCLVSYLPQYVNFLLNSKNVGKHGWDPVNIAQQSVNLLDSFSYQTINHTMFWNSVEIIRQFIERDYIVDCIFDRDGYLLKNINKYEVIVDEWNNLLNWRKENPTAKKLYYATGSHWIYHNKAELIRHEWLLNRRGRENPTRGENSPNLKTTLFLFI